MKFVKVIRVILIVILAVLVPLFIWNSCRSYNDNTETTKSAYPSILNSFREVRSNLLDIGMTNVSAVAEDMFKEPQILPGPREELEEIVTVSTPEVVEPVIDPNTPRLLRPCGYTVEELEKGLLKNLKQHASIFLEAEKETGVNAIFLCSIAAQESGWGTSYLAENNNNFFGWKRTATKFRHFDSPYDGIMTVARGIKKNYLTETGSCFNGYEIKDIAILYCENNQQWVKTIDDIMGQIERRINA